jgi:hypothetical protein
MCSSTKSRTRKKRDVYVSTRNTKVPRDGWGEEQYWQQRHQHFTSKLLMYSKVEMDRSSDT